MYWRTILPQEGGCTFHVPSSRQWRSVSPCIVYPTPHWYTAELVTPSVVMLNDAPGDDDNVEQATKIHDTKYTYASVYMKILVKFDPSKATKSKLIRESCRLGFIGALCI